MTGGALETATGRDALGDGSANLRPCQFVTFLLGDQHYGLALRAVERVVRLVEVTPLPRAPEIVSGVINVQGQIVPVVNVRKRFRLPEREARLSDQLVIARTSRRLVALLTDGVTGVLERAEREIVAAEAIAPGLEYISGVVKLSDGMVLIHDLDRFLALDEERAIEEAMTNA